ncbi:MAG: type II secretion system protein [Candidatus Omnitrophica bacterium]|nr:type II secretion system protein [Candidatus Omnitrophota bacterium]
MAKKQRALTLIELLLVVALVAIIGIALFSTLRNGIDIWRRFLQPLPQQDLVLAFDRFSQDIKNAVAFSSLPFTGDRQQVNIATVVRNPLLKVQGVGQVSYIFDDAHGALLREEKDFSHLYSRGQGIVRPVASGLSMVRFEYYFYDAARKEFVWLNQWNQGKLPLAVRMYATLDDDQDESTFTKTVEILQGK